MMKKYPTWAHQLKYNKFNWGLKAAIEDAGDWSLCAIGEGLKLNDDKNWAIVSKNTDKSDNVGKNLKKAHKPLFQYGMDFAKHMANKEIKKARATAKQIRDYILKNGGAGKIREEIGNA